MGSIDNSSEQSTPDALTPQSNRGAGSDAGHDAGTTAPHDAGSPPTPDAGPVDPCAAVHCAAGSHCVAGSCACDVGFISDGGTCTPGDPGVPALRSAMQVCAAWTAGHAVADAHPFSKSTTTCDPGVLTRQGIDDTLTRLAMFRYLAGLGPVTDEMASDTSAQACSLIAAWNPAGPNAHFPPPTSTCYTSAGAGAAGESNIAWGPSDPSNAIDQWMIDDGNETSFGHRRWLLNPPLGPIGMGFYEGGNNYGSASCIEVFGASGGGPNPHWIAYPSPGFQPLEVTQWIWTVQGDIPEQDAGVEIQDSTGAHLGAAVQVLGGNYGYSDALRIDRNGWTPAVGETYHVTLTGEGHAPIVYDVKPIDCP